MVRREHNLRGWSVTPGSEHTSMYTGRYRCREDRRVPTCFIKADKLDSLLVSIKEDVGNGNCYCGRC